MQEEEEEPLSEDQTVSMKEEEGMVQGKFETSAPMMLQREEIEEEEPAIENQPEVKNEEEEIYQAKFETLNPLVLQRQEDEGNESVIERQVDNTEQEDETKETITPSEYLNEKDEFLQGKLNAQSRAQKTTSNQSTIKSTIQRPDYGSPLPKNVREKVEPALGMDMSHVKVHSSYQSAESSEALNAKAFTHKNHIWLGRNQNPTDIKLMAHELTHVAQQNARPGSVQLVQQKYFDHKSKEDNEINLDEGLDNNATELVQMQLEVNAERLFEPAEEAEEPEIGTREQQKKEGGESKGKTAKHEGTREREEGKEAATEATEMPASAEPASAESSSPIGGREVAGEINRSDVETAQTEESPRQESAGQPTSAAGAQATGGGQEQRQDSGAGERAVGGGGGGAPRAECYRENYEEPEEEPDEEPEEPESTESEENIESETPEVENEEECPVGDEVQAQAEAAAPADGAASAAAEVNETDTGARTGGGAAASEVASGVAAPETQAMADTAGASEGEAEAARAPIEEAIVLTEAKRGEAISAYQTSALQLDTARQNVQQLQKNVRFAPEEGAGESGNALQAEATNRATGFFSEAAKQIEESIEMAQDVVPGRLGALAEVIKAEISTTIETEKETISARIEAARSQAINESETTRQGVVTEHDTAVANMETETAIAIDMLTAEYETSMGQIDDLETTGLDGINALYENSRIVHEEIGINIGQEAFNRGEEYYNAYEACKIYKPDSFWAGHLTDRRAEAQQNAAREVAKGYKDNLEKAGKDQAHKAMKGRQKDRCAVIEAARQARNTLDDQFNALVESLEAGLEQAIQSAGESRDQLLASIENALTSTLRILDQQERSQRQAANDTGYLQQVAIEQAARSAAASIQTSVADAAGSLQGALLEVQNAFTESTAPDPKTFDKILTQTLNALEGGLRRLMTQVDQGTAQAEAQLIESGTKAHNSLSNVTQSNDEQASSLSDGFSGSMNLLAEGASNSFDQQTEQYVQQVQTATQGGITGFQQIVTGFDSTISAIATNIESTLIDSQQKLEQSLRESKAGMESERTGIPKHAREAASKEQPAWKSVVKWVLIIAIIIVVALVIGPAVIGAVGAAAAALGAGAAATAIGAIVGGAIVGAVTSATIQVINNWASGQDLTEGVGRAAIMGAIGGAFGGGAGFLIGKYVSTQVLQFAANIAADAILEVGTELVTGEFSWEALGMAILMSFATGGFGEIKGIRNIQARMQFRGARVVPGARARAHAESIRPPGVGLEPRAPARPRTEVEVEAPTAPRPVAEAETPHPAVRSETEAEAPRTRPEAEAEAPAVRRPEAEVEPPSRRSAHPDEPEVEPGVVAKRPMPDGHEIKVTRDGRCITCSDSCGEIRMKYAQELADNPNLKSELDRIEGIDNPNIKAKEAAELRLKLDDLRVKGAVPGFEVEGNRLAKEAGLPDTPDGYHWSKQSDGSLIIKRNPNKLGDLLPIRYDPDSPTGFRPDVIPPEGYHWAQNPDGSFTLKRNPGTSKELPQIEYDPNTGGFKNLNTGRAYVSPEAAAGNWGKHDYGDPSVAPCFVPGTFVKTPEGERTIETLALGDLVFTHDFKVGGNVACPVIRVYENWTEHLVDVLVKSETITVTRRHMFWEEKARRWLPAEELEAGMCLYLVDNRIAEVKSVRAHDEKSKTYNLEIVQMHNFFVGASGVLVHNANGEEASNFALVDRKSAKIYEVYNTKTKEVVYVGKTTQPTVGDRFKQHLAEKPHWADNPDIGVREIHRGKWTDYETAVWEKHFIDERTSRGFHLENDPSAPPISRDKYNQFKHLHNPCR